MRGLGCRFALDDFGTGVNSLKYLKRLEVDRVKIDGSFVTDLFTNVQSVATVRAIVGLTRELNIETVAEYAENPETIARLRDLGVDYAQGYGVEHPRPFGEVLEGLRTAQSASLHRLQLEI
jgi:EAL domain-containing protein (putative c-di-GMP-specific phosphodiesterase class I)